MIECTSKYRYPWKHCQQSVVIVNKDVICQAYLLNEFRLLECPLSEALRILDKLLETLGFGYALGILLTVKVNDVLGCFDTFSDSRSQEFSKSISWSISSVRLL